ncbi:MAG: AMP-binding protein [Planctomycetota bacterium]
MPGLTHRPSKLPPADVIESPARPVIASLVHLLKQQAMRYPNRVAFRFLHDDTQEPELTFAELEARARAIGEGLASRLSVGDRAVLVFPPGLEFIGAFFGCLYAGVVAAPATYPKPRRPLPRMSRIAEDSGAKVALTTAQTLSAIDFDQQDDVARGLEWLAVEDMPGGAPNSGGWRPHEATGDDLAFLQYTSGSTSEPKGVMVTHGNLLANLEAIRVAFGLPEETSEEDGNAGVFWLPAYHDMGLIGGVLTPLYVGGPSVLMPPPAFLQRPLRWLEAIDRYSATISGGPDFAYRLCVDRIPAEQRSRLDLSAWRLAFCGAEPVHASTLDRFAEAFAPAGFSADAFYPCYGLAESTLLAAGPDCHHPPVVRAFDRQSLGEGRPAPPRDDHPHQRLVGCGAAPAGHELTVVDPDTLQPLADRTIGEVLIEGPSVAQGYWRRDEESAEAFLPADSVDGSPRLRTGDLGFLDDGELFITGRRKDVVILRGRNHFPQDIEQTAEAAHPQVQIGAAFAVSSDGGERLVLVHQIERTCRKDARPAVAEAIRRAVLAEHEVEPAAVVLIRTGALPVTSSGKVQRSQCRRQYEAGALRVLYESQTGATKPAAPAAVAAPALDGLSAELAAERIEEWMVEWLATKTDLDASAFDRDRPFAELGLDSLTAVELSGELEEAFGVPLPPVVAWNYPTPAALARYLAEQSLASGNPDDNGSETPGDEQLASLLEEIEGLSDEEAARLLAEE